MLRLLKLLFHGCKSNADVVTVVALDPTREFTSAALFRCRVCTEIWEETFNGSYTIDTFRKK